MIRLLMALVLMVMIVLLSGCGQSGDAGRRTDSQVSSVEEGTKMSSRVVSDSEKAVISQVIEDSIGWALKKDKDLLFSVMLQDSSFFIYHPDNRSTIRSFEAFRDLTENVFMNDAFKATGFEVKDLRVNVYNGGDVAWWSCMLDDFGEWNGKSTSWVNARWTGVMEKKADGWKIAQMHFSFATDADKS